MASCVGSLLLSCSPFSHSRYPSSASSASAVVVVTGLRSRTVENLVIRTRTIGTRKVAVASSVRGNPTKREVVVPAADYRIPLVLLGLCGGFVYQDNLLVAAPFGLLGLLLLFQTTRVRFVFGEDALELKIGEELQESGENVFVGGENCWKYSTFVNWEFWWPNFPILVYFKETQTKPEGQVHFFPVIANGKQLYDVMVERAGSSKTSGPKDSSKK
ncbi:hypothetical protein ZOSMA_4G01740 [Zostera marina]|uniref:DUF3119 family protein n=1 Tax=Zostera marina TaxID=29655 RepID=A0A0K9P0Z0_ZOSMR|nr:hypothetical protein ZOSMA_4G01740 [Zostera marina]